MSTSKYVEHMPPRRNYVRTDNIMSKKGHLKIDLTITIYVNVEMDL
jgi:hypothetical protein